MDPQSTSNTSEVFKVITPSEGLLDFERAILNSPKFKSFKIECVAPHPITVKLTALLPDELQVRNFSS